MGKKKKGEWNLTVTGTCVMGGSAWCKFKFADGQSDFWGVNVSIDPANPDWRGKQVGNKPSRRNKLGQAQA